MDYFNENSYINSYQTAEESRYDNYPPAIKPYYSNNSSAASNNEYIYEPISYSNDATYYTTQFRKPLYNSRSQTRIAESFNPMNQNKLDEALEFIKKSIMDELDDELFYSALINQAIDKEDKDIITSIRDNEIKHNKILRDVYYSLTGTTLPQARQTKEMEASTYIQNLKKALMGEIEAADKYRKILVAMPDKQNIFHILEILVDELRHADKYSYLLTKNKISKLAPPA